MVNATRFLVLLLGLVVLTGAAWLRSAEYDEQYTLFLTAGVARPDWPPTVFPAGDVALAQTGHARLAAIAGDLRATDVHPPLYFWAVSLWRLVFGPSLFAARMLSVVCGLVSLGLLGSIARRSGLRPGLAMLLTLGCYGFVYTNAIARGFAPALALLLGGVVLLSGRRPLLAGVCLGAACCCNYLAVFVAAAVVVGTGGWLAVPAALPFLALDGWFFVAQHGSRTGQFPPFALWPSVERLAEYQLAAVFGGLPLYVDGAWRIAVEALVGMLGAFLIVAIVLARPLLGRRDTRMALLACVATPAGLILLGLVFDNTPIELRYLSFGLPFVALLSAWVRVRSLLAVVLAVQFVSVAGLLFSARTMQPALAAATEAGRLAGDGIVLVPLGNDGVGVVGAFGIEAAAGLPLLVVGPSDAILERIEPYHRVVLALLAQDRDSVAAIEASRIALTAANWRVVAIGSKIEVYQREGAK